MRKIKRWIAVFSAVLTISLLSVLQAAAEKTDADKAMEQLRMEDEGPDLSEGIIASAESGADVNSYSTSSETSRTTAISYSSNENGAEMLSDNIGVEKSTDDWSGYKSVEAEMRKLSDGVYEMLDEDGEVIAVYEEMEEGDVLQSRASWSIDWTVKPGVQTAGTSRIESYDGLQFSHSIKFSRTGASKIGIASHDEKYIYWGATSTNGFEGVITINRAMGKVSLAIRNDSSNTITYTGTYSM